MAKQGMTYARAVELFTMANAAIIRGDRWVVYLDWPNSTPPETQLTDVRECLRLAANGLAGPGDPIIEKPGTE